MKVSIIVPVYNVRECLADCMESLENQTYQDLEIILVDDGSTDGSGTICDAYSIKDQRVKVIHKENGGLSDARNAGMAAATGDYWYFIDSDDMIAPDAIERMVDAALEQDADLVIARLQMFYDTCNIDRSNSENAVEVTTAQEAIRRMLLHQGIGHQACGKLYSGALWQNEQFPKGMLYEDYACIYNIVSRSHTVVILPDRSYYYRMRSGSIMKSQIRQRNMILLDVSENTTRFITETFPAIREEAEYLQLVTYLKLLKGILDVHAHAFEREQERIVKFARAHQYLMKRPWFKRSDRIKMHMLGMNKHLFYYVYGLGEYRNRRKL